MAQRLEVSSIVPDSRVNKFIIHLQAVFPKLIFENAQVVDVYTIDKEFSDIETTKIIQALVNPLTQQATTNSTQINNSDFAIEIGFLPGVTDNISHTTKEIIEDLLKIKFQEEENVYTSQIIFLKTNAQHNQIHQIAKSLINPLVQRVHVKSQQDYTKDQGMDLIIPKVKLTSTPQVQEVNLNISDDELIKIGKEGIFRNPRSNACKFRKLEKTNRFENSRDGQYSFYTYYQTVKQ